MGRTKQTSRRPRFFEQHSFHSVPSSAGFIHLILLRSLLLDFPCATPATPIAPDHLFLNVLLVGRMARPPYSRGVPVPSSAGFIHLILLLSLLLDFPCAALATPIAQDRLFGSGQELSANIPVPPLPELPRHKFHLCAIRRNRRKDTLGKSILWIFQDLPVIHPNQTARERCAALRFSWLDFPINSGTGALGRRLGINASIFCLTRAQWHVYQTTPRPTPQPRAKLAATSCRQVTASSSRKIEHPYTPPPI